MEMSGAPKKNSHIQLHNFVATTMQWLKILTKKKWREQVYSLNNA